MRFRLSILACLLLAVVVSAHADAALLLEESFGRFGKLAPTGHAAIYLTNVCAASPIQLRPCEPGEAGVVIGRYRHVSGYDWLAIPLLPYLYAVENPREIPQTADSQLMWNLRNAYRQKYLQDVAPMDANGYVAADGWWRLVGAAYERRIYGLSVTTTRLQDLELIQRFNSRRNRGLYNLLFRNCADFSRLVLNQYYPHAVHRDFVADVGIMTPKQVARSFTHYARKHPELQLSTFVIPQVSGNIPRSQHLDGILEAILKSKKYVVPMAILMPPVTGVLAVTYLAEGRFNPRQDAVPMNLARVTQPASGAAAFTATNPGATTSVPTVAPSTPGQ